MNVRPQDAQEEATWPELERKLRNELADAMKQKELQEQSSRHPHRDCQHRRCRHATRVVLRVSR